MINLIKFINELVIFFLNLYFMLGKSGGKDRERVEFDIKSWRWGVG